MEKVKQALQSPFSSTENFAITLGLVGTVAGAGYAGYKLYQSKKGSESPSKTSGKTKADDSQSETSRPKLSENTKFQEFEKTLYSKLKDISEDPTRRLTSQDILEMIQAAEYHNRSRLAGFYLANLKERQEHLKANNLNSYLDSVQNFLDFEARTPSDLMYEVGDKFKFTHDELDEILRVSQDNDDKFSNDLTKVLFTWVHDDAFYKPTVTQLTKETVLEAYDYCKKNIKVFDNVEPEQQFDYSQIYLNDLIYQKFGFSEYDLLRESDIKDSKEVIQTCEELQVAIEDHYRVEEVQATEEEL